MKILMLLATIVCLAGCDKRAEDVEKAVAKAIPDGEVLVLTSSASNALLVLSHQTMLPENMDFVLYIPDDTGAFHTTAPSVSKQNQTVVTYPPFQIGWSGATLGRGYLYTSNSSCGLTRPADLKIYRTRTNDISAVNMDFNNITYEQIEW